MNAREVISPELKHFKTSQFLLATRALWV